MAFWDDQKGPRTKRWEEPHSPPAAPIDAPRQPDRRETERTPLQPPAKDPFTRKPVR